MKSAIFFALAGVALAQNLEGEPACATGCLSSAIAKAGCKDQACACESQAAIGAFAAPCLIATCNADDLLAAQSIGSELCVKYSATAGAGGSGTATGSASAPTITSGPTGTGTSAPSGTGSGSGSQTTSGSESTGSAAPSGTNGGNISPSGTEASSGTETTAAPTSTNFAAVATPMAVGALAALVGLVGAL